MLKESAYVRQNLGEPPKRWFTDEEFDLAVWTDPEGRPISFQLGYDKSRYYRALTWDLERGFKHQLVDDGENRPGRFKGTPILLPDGEFEGPRIAGKFDESALGIDPMIAEFVRVKFLEFLGR